MSETEKSKIVSFREMKSTDIALWCETQAGVLESIRLLGALSKQFNLYKRQISLEIMRELRDNVSDIAELKSIIEEINQ